MVDSGSDIHERSIEASKHLALVAVKHIVDSVIAERVIRVEARHRFSPIPDGVLGRDVVVRFRSSRFAVRWAGVVRVTALLLWAKPLLRQAAAGIAARIASDQSSYLPVRLPCGN